MERDCVSMRSQLKCATASLLLGACAACGSGELTPVSPTTQSGYAGEWRGTTSQGEAIGFVVSRDSKVTAITVTYRLNACAGTTNAVGLALDIAVPTRPPENPGGGPFDNPGFTYLSAPTMGPNFYSVTGAFASHESAVGVIGFSDFMGCGTAIATWNARRQ